MSTICNFRVDTNEPSDDIYTQAIGRRCLRLSRVFRISHDRHSAHRDASLYLGITLLRKGGMEWLEYGYDRFLPACSHTSTSSRTEVNRPSISMYRIEIFFPKSLRTRCRTPLCVSNWMNCRISCRTLEWLTLVCTFKLIAYTKYQITYSSRCAICFGHCGASFVASINVVICAVTSTACCARVSVIFLYWRCGVRAHIIDCNIASAVWRRG